jgi:bifunctional non-homologous end joining protein LigD
VPEWRAVVPSATAPAQYGQVGQLPAPFVPMLATPGIAPSGDGWAVEFKWDGVRALVTVDPAHGLVRAISRNLKDITGGYPELDALVGLVDRPVLLDGELVVLDEHGRPSFLQLAHRMHVRSPGQSLLQRMPVQFYVFDLLHDGDRSLLDVPLLRRRQRLEELGLELPGLVRTPPQYTEVSAEELLAVAGEAGLEGVVSKRVTSPYQPGRRSPAWIKTPLRYTQEVIVGGWTDGEGRRGGTFGSLLLGVRDERDGRLRYVGHVGTGFTDGVLQTLHGMLRERERPVSPFDEPVPPEHSRRAHWAHPDLVGEVEHRQWTPDNRLRHPSWRGLRPDRDPDEIRAPFLA